VKGAANPVDVKKVLVIGSGGLAIGQAGEFDYSGLWPHSSRLVGAWRLGKRGKGYSTKRIETQTGQLDQG